MQSDDISIEIGGLADLDLSALREHWREVYESEAPVRMSRELLIQAIAYRMQEKVLGGLSRAARMKLAAGSSGSAGAMSRRTRTQHRIKSGTRFLREWQGQMHEVTAMDEDHFLYRGVRYRSLSVIARHITGTRWSGPAFFGLKQRSGDPHAPE